MVNSSFFTLKLQLHFCWAVIHIAWEKQDSIKTHYSLQCSTLAFLTDTGHAAMWPFKLQTLHKDASIRNPQWKSQEVLFKLLYTTSAWSQFLLQHQERQKIRNKNAASWLSQGFLFKLLWTSSAWSHILLPHQERQKLRSKNAASQLFPSIKLFSFLGAYHHIFYIVCFGNIAWNYARKVWCFFLKMLSIFRSCPVYWSQKCSFVTFDCRFGKLIHNSNFHICWSHCNALCFTLVTFSFFLTKKFCEWRMSIHMDHRVKNTR